MSYPESCNYNPIGQLIENKAEQILYFYNASGLVTEVWYEGSPKVKFMYNDRNHRVKKESYHNRSLLNSTFYVRDVAGQVMAIYTEDGSQPQLVEQPIYGAGRIGVQYTNGLAVYELTDHLGNVRALFTKKSARDGDLEGYTDYYPFGSIMPGRTMQDAEGYRYGYQGQYAEKDEETGLISFELRMYDSRIGRWISPDPYGQFDSPYIGMGNNSVNFTDPDGGYCPDCPDSAGDIGAGSFLEGDTWHSSDGQTYTYLGGDFGWSSAPEVTITNGLNLNSDGFSLNSNITLDKIKALENSRPAMGDIENIILHRTVSYNYPGPWMKLKSKIKGAHFYVDTDGTAYQTASLNTSVAHIYSSSSKQMYPEYFGVLQNTNSVGIEVVGNYKDGKWDPLTTEQIDATTLLVQQIKNHYNIHCDNIYAHEKVQRKTAGEGQTVLKTLNIN